VDSVGLRRFLPGDDLVAQVVKDEFGLAFPRIAVAAAAAGHQPHQVAAAQREP